jgi:hypothetical protein
VSHPVHALPRPHSKATNPSSHMAMVLSLLSSSLSRARSYSCNLTAGANVATASEGEEVLHQSTSGDQRHDMKQAQAITDVE